MSSPNSVSHTKKYYNYMATELQETSNPNATIIVSSRKSSNDAIYYQTVAKSNNFTGVVDSQNVMELSFHNSRDLFSMHLTALSTSMEHTWH